jgi:hypothetical protein
MNNQPKASKYITEIRLWACKNLEVVKYIKLRNPLKTGTGVKTIGVKTLLIIPVRNGLTANHHSHVITKERRQAPFPTT